MPRAPFDLLVAPALVAFKEAHPGVELEIAVEARLVDIVKEGYDAGLRYGNCLDGDMVAAQVAPASEAILVASPEYLAAAGVPDAPGDLLAHRSITCRSQSTGTIIPWNLRSGLEAVQIVPPRATIVHDLTSQIDLTARGLGIVSAPAAIVATLLEDRTLSRVLPNWSSSIDALYIYFPSRRHQSAALRAFVTFLKGRARRRDGNADVSHALPGQNPRPPGGMELHERLTGLEERLGRSKRPEVGPSVELSPRLSSRASAAARDGQPRRAEHRRPQG